MEVREKVMIEDLVKQYQKNQNKESFNELFTICHKYMLKFLLGKRLHLEDAEDLLQEYFFKEFEKSILTYRLDSKRPFLNYVKQIVIYRFYSHQKKRKVKLEHEINFDDTIEKISIIPEQIQEFEEESIVALAKAEIKEFFKDLVLNIENENHRNAIILRLCLPIRLTNEEIGEILDCNQASYGTWVYRGILELQSKIVEMKDKLPLNLEGMLKFIKGDSFSFKADILEHLNDDKRRKIIFEFFFSHRNYSQLSQSYKISEEDVKLEIREGLFELITLLNKRELLFRQGEDLMLQQDDVLDFINRLDETLAMDAEGILTRNSVTTGDREIDQLLTAMYSLYQSETDHSDFPEIKEQLLDYIKENQTNMQSVQKEFGLTMSEVNSILAGQTLNEESLKKLIFLKSEPPKETHLSEEDYDRLSKEMLEKYHNNKI